MMAVVNASSTVSLIRFVCTRHRVIDRWWAEEKDSRNAINEIK
jgi:hypothetical protein